MTAVFAHMPVSSSSSAAFSLPLHLASAATHFSLSKPISINFATLESSDSRPAHGDYTTLCEKWRACTAAVVVVGGPVA